MHFRKRTKPILIVGTVMAFLPATTLSRAAADERPEAAIRQVEAFSTAFAYAAGQVEPSVVSIHATKKIQAMAHFGDHVIPNSSGSPFDDDFLRRFFGGRIPDESFVQQGVGSGVIVDRDGHILTNNHVVAEADELEVVLSGGQRYQAHVVGTDPMTDLAVIQITGGKLQAATLGDSDSLKVGSWVLAVGDPFGLSDTITAGIVSATGRSNVRIAAYEDFIQTDAAVNPGNSGGPLVNIRGEVVGINTAIASSSGGNNGIGFAIPINMAKSIMQALIAKGRVVRGFLGVTIQPLDERLAKSFGFSSTAGVLIGDVNSGSPGDKAGLQPGDIVVTFSGTKTTDVAQLRNLVAATEPGSKVDVEVFRDGRPQKLGVTIGELGDRVAAVSTPDSSGDIGLSVSDLSPPAARALGYDDPTGALVTAVDPLGPAARAGIAVNDVIVDVQGTRIRNASEFRNELRKQDMKNGVRLVVRSGQTQRFVFLHSEE